MSINDLTTDNKAPQSVGLISPSPSSNGANLGAAEWSVAPDQTVEGRIESITKKSSPLMQLAESRAAAKMNERGLLNTSLAVGAGQTALYEAAMPMAQQDAATYARAGEFNTGQKNQFSLQANDNVNALGRMDKQQGFDITKLGVQQGYTQANMSKQQEYDIGKMGIDQQNILSRMTAAQQNDLAKLATSQGYTLQNMTAQQINDLIKLKQVQEYDLTKIAVTQENQLKILGEQFKFDVSKMNLDSANILSRMSVQQQQDIAKLAISQGYDLTKISAQQVNDLAKLATNQSYTEKNAATAADVQKDRDQVAIKADKDTAATLAKSTADRDVFAVNASKDTAAKLAETQQKYADVQIAANKASALFSANVQSELAQLNHDNAAILNKSNYAVGAMSKYSDAINNIAMSTLSPEAKNAAQQNAFTAYKDQLRLVSSLGNVADLSTLLDFSKDTPKNEFVGPAVPVRQTTSTPTDYVTTTPDKGTTYTPYAGGNKKGLINEDTNTVYQ